MIYDLKMSLKKNKAIDAMLRIVSYPVFKFHYIQAEKLMQERSRSQTIDERYAWIRSLKDVHKGQRCFIVATGPSLTLDDLNLIKGEHCFGMNSDVLLFDKTDWRPEYYGIQDEYVYNKLEKEILNRLDGSSISVFVSDNIKEKFQTPVSFKPFFLNCLDHKMFHRNGYGTFKYSTDCYAGIYDAYSITFSIMQLACYMGFQKIYLLGCDCNYNQKKGHFMDYGLKDPKANIMGDKMICGHYEFNKFAQSIGVEVYNCTRGGMLEVYPRKALEEVMAEEKQV